MAHMLRKKYVRNYPCYSEEGNQVYVQRKDELMKKRKNLFDNSPWNNPLCEDRIIWQSKIAKKRVVEKGPFLVRVYQLLKGTWAVDNKNFPPFIPQEACCASDKYLQRLKKHFPQEVIGYPDERDDDVSVNYPDREDGQCPDCGQFGGCRDLFMKGFHRGLCLKCMEHSIKPLKYETQRYWTSFFDVDDYGPYDIQGGHWTKEEQEKMYEDVEEGICRIREIDYGISCLYEFFLCIGEKGFGLPFENKMILRFARTMEHRCHQVDIVSVENLVSNLFRINRLLHRHGKREFTPYLLDQIAAYGALWIKAFKEKEQQNWHKLLARGGDSECS
jgi:hypothetical protein